MAIGFAAAIRTTASAGALLALLAGCAAPPKAPPPRPYTVAPGVPTAKLVMRGHSFGSGQIYGVVVFDDASNCKGGRVAGAGDGARNPTTVPLAAGSLATVDFLVRRGTTVDKPDWCVVRWSFTPAANRSYLITGGPTAAACTATVLDATNPDAIRPVGGAVRRNLACATLAPLNPAQGGQSDGAAVLNPGANDTDLRGLIGK